MLSKRSPDDSTGAATSDKISTSWLTHRAYTILFVRIFISKMEEVAALRRNAISPVIRNGSGGWQYTRGAIEWKWFYHVQTLVLSRKMSLNLRRSSHAGLHQQPLWRTNFLHNSAEERDLARTQRREWCLELEDHRVGSTLRYHTKDK